MAKYFYKSSKMKAINSTSWSKKINNSPETLMLTPKKLASYSTGSIAKR
jgi:hypothetical protein